MYHYNMFKDHSITYEFTGTRDQFNELMRYLNGNKVADMMVEDIGYADMILSVDEDGDFIDLIPQEFAILLVQSND